MGEEKIKIRTSPSSSQTIFGLIILYLLFGLKREVHEIDRTLHNPKYGLAEFKSVIDAIKTRLSLPLSGPEVEYIDSQKSHDDYIFSAKFCCRNLSLSQEKVFCDTSIAVQNLTNHHQKIKVRVSLLECPQIVTGWNEYHLDPFGSLEFNCEAIKQLLGPGQTTSRELLEGFLTIKAETHKLQVVAKY